VRNEEKLLVQHLHEHKQRYTPERKTILEVFLSCEEHLSLDDLYLKVKKVNALINHSTTYRTMKVLTDLGLARAWKGLDKKTYYEHNYKHAHHDHMVCERCQAIIEFNDAGLEKLQEKIAGRHGFVTTNHQLTIYGLCAMCAKEKKQ
jgi:Fur family ferric uptake transcriptional regulator